MKRMRCQLGCPHGKFQPSKPGLGDSGQTCGRFTPCTSASRRFARFALLWQAELPRLQQLRLFQGRVPCSAQGSRLRRFGWPCDRVTPWKHAFAPLGRQSRDSHPRPRRKCLGPCGRPCRCLCRCPCRCRSAPLRFVSFPSCSCRGGWVLVTIHSDAKSAASVYFASK